MLEVTYGINTARAGHLQHTEVADIFELSDFIRGMTVRLAALGVEGLGSFASWHALPKKQRDKLKIRTAYMTAAVIAGSVRALEHATVVNKLILDIDKGDLSHHQIELMFHHWATSFFETANSIGGGRRWRAVLPLATDLTLPEFDNALTGFLDTFGFPADACSRVPVQPQMLPLAFDDYVPQVYAIDGEYLDLAAYIDTAKPLAVTVDATADDAAFVNYRAPDPRITLDQIRAALVNQDATERDNWRRVGMMIHHQTGGSEEGFTVWDEWSAAATSAGNYDPDQCRTEWDNFDSSPRNKPPVTIHGLIPAPKVERINRSEERIKLVQEIQNCADEDELRHQFTWDIAGNTKFDNYDRNVLAEALQKRLAELVSGMAGRAVKPMPIAEVRAWLNPRRLIGNTPPNKGKKSNPTDCWPKGWAYIQNGDEFIELATKRRCSPQGFNAEFNRRMTGADGVMEFSAAQYALYTSDHPIPVVSQMMYWPGQDEIFKDEATGVEYINTWNKASVPEAWDPYLWGAEEKRAVRSVLRLLCLLMPRRERKIFFYWMAWIVQNEGRHMNWCPVVQGPQGCGKTMIADVMRAAVGASNAASIDAHVLGTGFTAWAEGHLLKIVEEIRLPGERGTAHSIMNSLKPYITNMAVSIHRKGRDPVEIPNVTNYLMLTNHEDAIPLEQGDRRYFVVFTKPRNGGDVQHLLRTRPNTFYDVVNAIRNFPHAIRGYLMSVKIPASFEPFGHAPHTDAKEIMRANALPGDEGALTEVLCENFYGCNGPAGVAISRAVVERMRTEHGVQIRTARFGMLMRQQGWEKFEGGGGRVRWRGQPHIVYLNTRLNGISNGNESSDLIRTFLDQTVGSEFE